MTPPWALRILAESPLTLLAGVTGRAWIVPDAGKPVPLDPGDIVVTRAPGHYNVADPATTPPRAVIRPGQDCCDLNGNSLRDEWAHGVRTWGNDPRGETVFLVGAYERLSDVGDRLLRALPPVFSLSRAEWSSPLVPMLCDEVLWRMAIAADLLCSPGETVSSVAEKVGYATPFAFSAAFKRARGITPQKHRERARALSENAPLGASGRRRHSDR